MKCPYCNNEMEQGLLQGMRRIAWVKKQHKLSLLPEQDEIMLENNSFSDFTLSASICKKCKKIVVDYGDKDIQEG
ncbi:hypothetical protein Ami103574_10270 [Aminipila butyrica]|uniref:DUF6487 domain-containing protein n=1 Tax=Aminipila butyrica TaxID=433296 RepID=A0A858BW95_9FIRM|nr:PF20097 family protein [Aminipila butyrica]QIB69682.1 hypothetical protein Ami103574_10270 [Aminipila butyrica]